MPGFVALGLVSGVAGIFGMPVRLFGITAIIAGAACAVWFRRRMPIGIPRFRLASPWSWLHRMDRTAVVATITLVAMYVALAVERSGFGASAATAERYTYTAVAFGVVAVASSVRRLSWARTRATITLAFAASMALNLAHFPLVTAAFDRLSAREKTEWATLETIRAAPRLPMDIIVEDQDLPQLTARRFYAAADAYGDPTPRRSLEELAKADPDAVDSVLETLFSADLRFEPLAKPASPACRFTESSGVIRLMVPEGQTLYLSALQATGVTAYLSFVSGDQRLHRQDVRVSPSAGVAARMPEVGSARPWQVVLNTPRTIGTATCRR